VLALVVLAAAASKGAGSSKTGWASALLPSALLSSRGPSLVDAWPPQLRELASLDKAARDKRLQQLSKESLQSLLASAQQVRQQNQDARHPLTAACVEQEAAASRRLSEQLGREAAAVNGSGQGLDARRISALVKEHSRDIKSLRSRCAAGSAGLDAEKAEIRELLRELKEELDFHD
jgi:hypothetical protein